MKKLLKMKKDGFTIIEAITTTFMFSIIIVVISGTFALFLNAQRRAQNVQMVVENTNFIMELMTKELRMATEFYGANEGSCADYVEFKHPTNPDLPGMHDGAVRYYWSSGDKTFHRMLKDYTNSQDIDTILNSSSIEFTNLKFCTYGITLADQKQPRVTILATIRSKNLNQQITFNTQTTVSVRNIKEY